MAAGPGSAGHVAISGIYYQAVVPSRSVALLDHWGSGSLIMDNVEINDPVSTVPEPVTLLMLGTGLIGVGTSVRRRERQGR
jgi:hypothetical protein